MSVCAALWVNAYYVANQIMSECFETAHDAYICETQGQRSSHLPQNSLKTAGKEKVNSDSGEDLGLGKAWFFLVRSNRAYFKPHP